MSFFRDFKPFTNKVFNEWKQDHEDEFTQKDVDTDPKCFVFIWTPKKTGVISARSDLWSRFIPEDEKELALTLFMKRIFRDFYWDLL